LEERQNLLNQKALADDKNKELQSIINDLSKNNGNIQQRIDTMIKEDNLLDEKLLKLENENDILKAKIEYYHSNWINPQRVLGQLQFIKKKKLELDDTIAKLADIPSALGEITKKLASVRHLHQI
jgi:uncharacterized coiled-coil DUF342 family protein